MTDPRLTCDNEAVTPLNPEDCIPPDLPEDTAGIVNLLIEAVKLGEYRDRAQCGRTLSHSDLHELDRICHRLSVAAGVPMWYWFELVMTRPKLRETCQFKDCTEAAYEGTGWCVHHTF